MTFKKHTQRTNYNYQYLLNEYFFQQSHRTNNPLVAHAYGYEYTADSHLEHEPITYEEIISMENLQAACERIKSGVTTGLDGSTRANFTNKRLQKLHTELKTQGYKPKAQKCVQIPKPDGGKRPLGVASPVDKVVQSAILNKL